MSTVKSILAVIGDAVHGRPAVETAFRAGRALDAHVDVLHVKPDPVTVLPMVGEAMSSTMVNEMLTIAEREANARAHRARAVFDELVAQSKADASWIEDVGDEEEVVTLRACRADFTVLSRPIQENDPASLLTLNTALRQSGRPVLAAPPQGIPEGRGFARIALFWNGSPEATRAIAGGLGFLAGAAQVTILRVEEEEWSAPTNDIEDYLARHGVKSVVATVLPKQGKTGQTLLDGAAAANADLLVMGAYTRSKVRQLMLGSVTGYVMGHAVLPVLLCH